MSDPRPKRTRQRAAAKAVRPSLSDAALAGAEAACGYRFKDKALLVRGLTHPSAVSAADSLQHANQRLEFLGDRVLNLVIAERLIDRRRNETEGDLAPRLNRLVKKGACADAFRHAGLNAFILLSDNEVSSGGRDRESTLGDACEAVIAAIYLDGGLSAARKFIEKAWAPQFTSGPAETKDPKTLLQELVQGQGHPLPEYVVTSRSGPDHAPVYEVEVRIAPHGQAAATGASKRDAERHAAARMLEQLKGNT
ncbi:MAG: ribonuclease III [Hyphomonas sp.]|uniref:ribonuclease III n=1 Tax=Hyphomonas sp. TaxID=87 RepID=UPI0017C2D4B8|nr:ribonuclease III [Hyphomonas sp.]MBU3919677.1 ribonuclease III [Alphaproteobacteria bacterium]MBA3067108.1 ribonuclease III [Hyphomonas sp.]MBU4063096.1 ribonuclease III [Alphaproteobacteria bacterium]MBU4164413.1 ribonuclease III [Alphaproteobacteria bacterium]MBU4567954.1 ribonuclease III [Alphaproteobacteria bacterium]